MAWELNIQSVPGVAHCPHHSEGALEQAVAPAACGTDLLGAKPLHHVAGVASVSAGQAEVGGAPHGHVADGALEGEALADGTLGAAHLAAAVAAVHAELCHRGHTQSGTVSAAGIMDKAALHTAPRSADEPLKLPQSSIRIGEWMVFKRSWFVLHPRLKEWATGALRH